MSTHRPQTVHKYFKFLKRFFVTKLKMPCRAWTEKQVRFDLIIRDPMSLKRIPLSVPLICLALVAFARAEPLRVGAAVSLKEVVTDLVASYESNTNTHVVPTFNASGQLAAQIRAGAPIDVFLSAGFREIDDLAARQLIDTNTRVAFAGNELVLIVPVNARSTVKTFDDLVGPGVKRVAIGQPKVVPAGLYARQAFESLELTQALEARLVFGQSVRQVLDYVAHGEVDAGVVYRTDAATTQDVRVVAKADPSTHQPIEYLAVVVSGSKNSAEAKRFVEFLTRAESQELFSKRGFKATTQPMTRP